MGRGYEQDAGEKGPVLIPGLEHQRIGGRAEGVQVGDKDLSGPGEIDIHDDVRSGESPGIAFDEFIGFGPILFLGSFQAVEMADEPVLTHGFQFTVLDEKTEFASHIHSAEGANADSGHFAANS